METVNTLLLIFLELTFVFVVMLLLFSQRKSIGDIPFCITMGMLLVLGEVLGGSGLSFESSRWSFQIAPVVLMVPFMASVLLVYITDGVLSMQRLIIGALAAMGVFFYLGDLTRLEMRWITYSVSGSLPLEAFDFLLERSRRMMLSAVCGQLAALFIMPVTFSRLRNAGHRLMVCCAGALSIALLIDTLIFTILAPESWSEAWQKLPALLTVRIIVGIYLAVLLTVYISKLGREKESRQVKPLEILVAFFGGYGRSKLLEADLLEWEGRYRVILENASEMIVIIDRHGQVRDANRAAEKMIAGGKCTGKLFNDFLREEDRAAFAGALDLAASGTGSSRQLYVELLSGMPLALSVTAFTLVRMDAFIVMGRDMTEERSLEAEKQRLNEELAHSQRLEALGQLAGGVAHDFNNNIHAILGHADLIGFSKNLDDKTKRHLGKIIEIAEHSGQLTTQLLGFARKGKYRESDFDLRILIQRTAELFTPGSTDIELEVRTADKPLLVRGDQIQLQQVVLNLLINARDALRMVDDRERRLDVQLFELGNTELPSQMALPEGVTPQNAILLTITDNGCGMDEATQKKVFEPFFTTKPVGQGTGMGLAMAYGTIQSHHGAIGIKSCPGEGTSIYIVLPKLVS